jgi:hypothetical protein
MLISNVALFLFHTKTIMFLYEYLYTYIFEYREVAKISNEFVIVLLDNAQKIKLDSLLTSSLGRMKCLGCIAMESAISDLSVFSNYYPTVPVLVISSTIRSQERCHSLHPNMIWAVLSENLLPHWCQDQTIGVWLARTIAKYTEAVTLLMENDARLIPKAVPSSRL